MCTNKHLKKDIHLGDKRKRRLEILWAQSEPQGNPVKNQYSTKVPQEHTNDWNCSFSELSGPLFTIIFMSKIDNFKTRDFSPFIERVLAGVTGHTSNVVLMCRRESCNKVTPKINRVTLKERSELTDNQTHFGNLPTLPLNGVYRIQIFPPFYLAKERRAISAKERGRSCTLRPSSNWAEQTSRTEYNQRYLLSPPPLCWAGWDGFYKSVFCKQHFHDQLKIYESVLL